MSTAPVTSSAASLGAVAPVATAPVTTAPVTTAPVTTAPATTAAPTPNAQVPTGYSSQPVSGGGLGEYIGNAIGKITSMAQNSMNNVQNQLTAEMAASGGTVEPARLQQINQQMSTYEMMMQMAAKIQEKQDNAAQVWLRP